MTIFRVWDTCHFNWHGARLVPFDGHFVCHRHLIVGPLGGVAMAIGHGP